MIVPYRAMSTEIGLFSQLIAFAENNILLVFIAILRIAIHKVEYTDNKYDLIRIIQILIAQGIGGINSTFGTRDTN